MGARAWLEKQFKQINHDANTRKGMGFNCKRNRKEMRPPLKLEQQCQVDEAERGQTLFSTRLSSPAFRRGSRAKPCTSRIVALLLHIWLPAAWAAIGHLAAHSINAGCSFACIRYGAPLPNGPQHLAPCSLLIICSLSVIVARTCTFFR